MITICSPSIARSAISPRRCFASLMDTVVDIREFSLLLDEKQPFFRPGPFAPVPKACPPWRGYTSERHLEGLFPFVLRSRPRPRPSFSSSSSIPPFPTPARRGGFNLGTLPLRIRPSTRQKGEDQ